MKSIRRLILLLVFVCVGFSLASAQSYNSYQKRTFTQAEIGPVIKQNGLSAYHILSWTTSGTVSSCSIRIETSSDGVLWVDGGVILVATDCHVDGTATASGTANYLRLHLLTLSGGGTLTTTYRGYSQGVVNPSFSFNLPNPVVGDSGQYQHKLSTNAIVVRITCSVDQGTATINFDFRNENTPNTDSGTHVMTSGIVCVPSTTVVQAADNPLYSAYYPIALIVTGTSGSPSILRAHVTMVPQ
jgi:hypothetical protein